MAGFFSELLTNKLFLSILCSYVVASSIKILLFYFAHNKFDFKLFIRTGGMPSGHTASVSAMTTAVYLSEGLTTLFIVSLTISTIIIFDAVGIRRATGKQAEILNKIIEDYRLFKKLKTKRLYELLGHTPTEVFVGLILGILIARIMFLV
ncbi:divergent PAP2 family protein [Candidatus Woesearchaeota archaeon]|nr:divergent PAP2 family protein [Candidatus Woesearchaeota archaeon]